MYRAFFFFFSSRRRHTRCSRDWSSDVCSSDLVSLDFYHKDIVNILGVRETNLPFAARIDNSGGGLTQVNGFGPWYAGTYNGGVLSFEKRMRSEEHTSELQSRLHLVCRLLLEKKNKAEGGTAPIGPTLRRGRPVRS